MTQKQGRFLTGSTMRHVTVMAMTASIGLTFMFLIDAASLFWVSRIGLEINVAALGFAWTIQFFTVSVGIGLMIAAVALVSRSIGSGDRDLARRQATSAMVISFVMQAVMALIVWLLREPILVTAGAEGETLQIASRYLAISLPALPLIAVGMVGSSILRAEGDAVRSMTVTIVAGVVAMVLDPLFIFGFGLGVDGAAIVVVISRLTTAVLSIWFIVKVHDLAARPSMVDMRKIVKPFFIIAVPAVMTQLSTPFGNYIVTIFVSEYGDGAVAGWAVVSRLTVVAFGGIFALSGAVGGIFGQNYGAGLLDRVRSTYRDALLYCVIYVVLAWAVLFSLRGYVVDVFNLSPDGAEIVLAFTNLAAGGFIFTGMLFVSNAAFNNLGRPLWSTLANWSRDGVLMLPLCLLFGRWFYAPGVVYAQALAGVIVGTLAALGAWRFVNRLT
ncbi:MAG: MATE family efflux transporter [Rhodobacteraceae bacterium]|nr:MATE family efflux transporter [Paracoccaceae bacterium]